MTTNTELTVQYHTLNLNRLSEKIVDHNSGSPRSEVQTPTTPRTPLGRHDSDSFGSLSDYGRSSTVMSRSFGSHDLEYILSADDKVNETLSGNPKNWHWNQVSLWLIRKGLHDFIEVFNVEDEDNMLVGIEGEELLELTLEKLCSDPYDVGKKLKINREEALNHPLIERFFREVTKLELRANDFDHGQNETTINDLLEMRRRISEFVEKWDKILWISYYVETNNRMPLPSEICEELEVSESVASVYIQYYHSIDRVQSKDLNELLLDFNVYEDSVIWWFIIISSLKTYPSKSMWLIFGKVAELTPGSVAVELLEKYKYDLTRFKAQRLDKLCQNVVIGSQYPVCAALRIAKWFKDTARFDVARRKLFERITECYVNAANDYISFLESDHLATILLEVKSDIDGMSALDMALEYELHGFVSNNRVERVTNSIMNNFEFLKYANRDEAFEIDPLSLDLIWERMRRKEFYLTPLGLYITTAILYVCYLALFTYLSIADDGIAVFGEPKVDEIIFWVFNIGYIANELQQILSVGFKKYFSDASNYFDVIISIVFLSAFVIRCYGFFHEPRKCAENEQNDCWKDGELNTAFIILWGISTITLWLRLINFCVLSHKLGPMVQMIFKMIDNIMTFFQIMLILFLGFSFALSFIMGSVHEEFSTPIQSGLTLFSAILADFDFGSFEGDNDTLSYFGYAVMLLYLIIGSLVLLNLLIAMMATTYEHIDENATESIIFARFDLALSLDQDSSFMPPPLNVITMFFLMIFYIIEYSINLFVVCIFRQHSFDFAAVIMPTFLKARKLELDDQILFENCGKHWIITTHRGPTVCKAVKFNKYLNKHYIKFYETNGFEDHTKWDGLRVSVGGDVDKKHCWLLDLMQLHEKGLIDLKQFESVKVDRQWINNAHQSIVSAKQKGTVSPYWICGYCRGYVKESHASLKQLARLLNVHEQEVRILNKVSPVICPNCYRVRYERQRWELVWEIISIWMFYLFVFPLFFVIIGFGMLLKIIRDPAEMGRNFELLKSKFLTAEEEFVEFVTKEKLQSDEKEHCKYVTGHYNDTQLIAKLNAQSTEHKLFDTNIRDVVWEKLYFAKDAIDPLLLKMELSNHVMSISMEDELTPYEFCMDYINMDSLKKDNGQSLWKDYFEPLSMCIFQRVQKLRADNMPLHLFARYPFDLKELMDDFEQFYEQSPDHDKHSLKDCTKDEIIDALEELKCLNCQNREERQYILDSIEQSTEYRDDENNKNDKIFPKFVKYLKEVTSLFQDIRKIKNMLRDVNRAIIERGADASLFADQLYFLFDDIKNSIIALPFFNSMRTESTNLGKNGERKVELWTIRNTLKTIYFLINTTRLEIIRKNKKTYVSIDELLDRVFKVYGKDISEIDNEQQYSNNDNEQKEDKEQKEMVPDNANSHIDLLERTSPNQQTLNFGHRRNLSLIVGGNDDEDDDKTEEREIQKEIRQRIAAERMDLFRKEEITASAVRLEVTSIFKKLQNRRELKITETTIDYYRRIGLKEVRLLQDDEALRFIYEQLARYITFNPTEIDKECSVNLLKEILLFTLQFGEHHCIDDEAIPKMIKNNDKYIEQLYNHLLDLFKSTKFANHMKGRQSTMTLEDVCSIILLYQRIFSVVQQKIVNSADEFVVNHDLFCAFVDRDSYKIGSNSSTWTNKTIAASNLYQNVLDIQQNFVTLGQVRQTIDSLLGDIDAMKCGELIRIINHIGNRMKRDIAKCRKERKSWIDKINLVQDLVGTDVTLNQFDLDEEAAEDNEAKQSVQSVRLRKVSGANKTSKKNPSLQFKHIHDKMFNNFIQHIAHNFHHDIKSKDISQKLNNLEESEENEKKIIDVLLENTQFDIIAESDAKMSKMTIDESKEFDDYDQKAMDESDKAAARLKQARFDVFDTILSFNQKRITLQQLFGWTRHFRAFLKRNEEINKLMEGFGDTDKWNELKSNRIPSDLFTFRQQYFGSFQESKQMKLSHFNAEIEWLYEDTENLYDFCQRLFPFYSGQFIKDIYDFMESTEQIQGHYELKCAEFGQLKYSLNVNDESANRLFYIIRFKHRSLPWKSLYNYLIFILRMKYNVQRAILNAKQAEDTTVSSDGMKILLKISLNDESQWLFDKVLFFNGSKVTWKQIRNYLKKLVAVRADVRDFFFDQERDRNYEQNKAEIIEEIAKNVKKEKKEKKDDQNEIMKMLKEITKQNECMQKEIELLKNRLKN